MLTAPKTQERLLAPAGTHIARCVSLIHIGTVKTDWQGQEKWVDKIRLGFELSSELHVFKEGEEAKPFTVSKEYTLSLGDKSNLYPIVKGIVGDIPEDVRFSFDIEELIGKPCLLTISHKDSQNGKFVSIDTASPLMKGMTAPEQVNKSVVLTYEKWDKELFNSLPDFIKDKMKGSRQYESMFKSENEGEVIDHNEIPF